MDAETLAACDLSLQYFDGEIADESDEPVTPANVARAVVVGCRHSLLLSREPELRALRDGFSYALDLSLQLAPHPCDAVMLLVQGKHSISARDLLGCIAWDAPDSSPAAPLLRELIECDESEGLDEGQRRLLLRWCTGLIAVPVGGLKRRITPIEFVPPRGSPADASFPDPHTCSSELELPSYSSRTVLRTQLLLALRAWERDGGAFRVE